MSNEQKTLGQVAFEAWWNELSTDNEQPPPFCDKIPEAAHAWERAAHAVKAAIPLHELADMDQAAFEAMRQKLKAEGAAEERERLAALITERGKRVINLVRENPFHDSGPFDAVARFDFATANWLRAGGKP